MNFNGINSTIVRIITVQGGHYGQVVREFQDKPQGWKQNGCWAAALLNLSKASGGDLELKRYLATILSRGWF